MSKQEWPAAKTYKRDPKKLTPNPRNARTHSDDQIKQIISLIEKYGWTNPILVDEDQVIIAGHGRCRAAIQMGIKTVPVMIAKGWSEDDKRAYILADNQVALNAGWDDALLTDEVAYLMDTDIDMDILGFDQSYLDQVMSDGITEGEEGATPDPQTIAISKTGDIWVCGDHRIMCGDSTNRDDVTALILNKKPHLMVTDPPYGVAYDAGWRNEATRADGSKIGASAVGVVENDDQADWSEAWTLFPGDVAYVWHADNKAHVVAKSLIDCGLNIRAQIIWAKNQLVIGRGDYHPKHEPCWYAVRKGKKGHWNGDRKQTTVWNINKPQKSETGHSTQKPIECMARPIRNNSKTGDYVYDPFCGSGTTMIAAESLKRKALCMELSPNYVDVIVKRWQEHTGKSAILEGTKSTFDQIEKKRAKPTKK